MNQVNNERRVLFNQVLELKGNIRVFCRVRPLTSSELANNEKSAASYVIYLTFINALYIYLFVICRFPVESSIMIQNKKYDFDRVFDTSVDQGTSYFLFVFPPSILFVYIYLISWRFPRSATTCCERYGWLQCLSVLLWSNWFW